MIIAAIPSVIVMTLMAIAVVFLIKRKMKSVEDIPQFNTSTNPDDHPVEDNIDLTIKSTNSDNPPVEDSNHLTMKSTNPDNSPGQDNIYLGMKRTNPPVEDLPLVNMSTNPALTTPRASIRRRQHDKLAEKWAKDRYWPHDILENKGEIGRGAFGQVFQGEAKRDHRTTKVAVKTVRSGSWEAEEELVQEAELMSKLYHYNIINFLAISTKPSGEVLVVLEFCEGGCLKNLLDKKFKSLLRRPPGACAEASPNDPDIDSQRLVFWSYQLAQ